ncbi:hypothetical protein [Deinococcus hohokamensis]|uniref:MalT-like TPR region domain-containing protein n=1 Tax=Deinococcus hohokamensis TaxID=309883 RepID=A0ABV9I837_9DEIO
MNLIERPRLLHEIASASVHALLCAPAGYGKTVLLEQVHALGLATTLLTAQPGTTLLHVLNAVPLGAGGGPPVCLIDDAHLLSPETVAALVRHPPTDVRFVLALRHFNYSRVLTLWQHRKLIIRNAGDLAFTGEELRALDPGIHVPDTAQRTLGWPAMVVTERTPMAGLNAYFDELIEDLSPAQRDLLLDAACNETLDTTLLIAQRENQLPALLDTGFPVIPVEGRLEVHPAMRRRLQDVAGISGQVVRPPDEVLQNLIDLMPATPKEHRLDLIAYYFGRYGEDFSDTPQKIQLLTSVDVQDLPPSLRDLLAAYVMSSGDTDRAHRILSMQQHGGTDSTLTHVLLARVANLRIDFVAFREHLELARERARTDSDWAQVYRTETLLRMRTGRAAEALLSAEQHYRSALRSGRTDLIITGLSQIAWVRYMSGNLQGAREAAYEALNLAEGAGRRYVSDMTYLMCQLGEMTKDAGDHEEAMRLVQRGLGLQSDDSSLPYLYNTRGLIYLEYGQWAFAVTSFGAALEGFEARGNVAGMLMVHAYVAFALYMLREHEQLTAHARTVRELVRRVSETSHEYSEHLAYQPLVLGLARLAQDEWPQALLEFEQVSLEGKLGYDSVLLTHLLASQVRLKLAMFTETTAHTLVRILDARDSPGDPAARSYASIFAPVYLACAGLGVAPERFRSLAAGAAPQPVFRPVYRLRLSTLGKLALEVDGQSIATRSLLPLYALAFLALKADWKTTDAIAEELLTHKSDRRNGAFKSISTLRGLLKELDHELEKDLLSPRKDPRGYRLLTPEHVDLDLDVRPYLGPVYTPANPDPDELERLLENVAPFLPRLDGSDFAQDINRQLQDRSLSVSRHLARTRLTQERPLAATRALLLGLRFTPDPELLDLLPGAELPAALQEALEPVIQAVRRDDDRNLADIITDALTVLAALEGSAWTTPDDRGNQGAGPLDLPAWPR